MKYLSLFSGIGGFELGIQKAYESISKIERKQQGRDKKNLPSNGEELLGAECIGYSEIDKYAIQVYNKHFNHKNYGDATKIDTRQLPDFDLLVGGFPCQAFSIAGKRRGFDEARGTLFFDIARILADKKPRNFILENVKGLLSHDNGNTFTTIIRILSSMGYFVEWQVLNAKNFGVPQNRERVFIVGHLGGQPRRKVFPIGTGDEKNDLQINIMGHKDCYRRGNQVYDTKGIMETLGTCGGGGQHPCIPIFDSGGNHSDMDLLLQKARIRRLTPLECERLMDYPDGWTDVEINFIEECGKIIKTKPKRMSDTQRYKMCGNGIVSNCVSEIVKGLKN